MSNAEGRSDRRHKWRRCEQRGEKKDMGGASSVLESMKKLHLTGRGNLSRQCDGGPINAWLQY